MPKLPAPLKRLVVSSLALFNRELVRDFESGRFQLRRHLDLSRDQWHACRQILGRAPETVFDVGANIGATTLELRRRFPDAKIHCYEPTPAIADELRRNVRNYGQVQVHQCALGRSEGVVEFHLNKMGQTNSILPSSEASAEFNQSLHMQEVVEVIEVPMRTVLSECRRLGLSRIDILKTDAQGYDLEVIEGAIGEHVHIPLIYTEVCFFELYKGQPTFGQFHDRMGDLGYRLVDLYETGFRSHYYQISCNALYMRSDGPRPKR